MLDSKAISQSELNESRQRFERKELEQLMGSLKLKDEEIHSLKERIESLSNYKEESEGNINGLKQYIEQQKETINSLNTQLHTQQQLVEHMLHIHVYRL